MTFSQYLQIIWFRSFADIRAERERTYLGLLWWLLEPILFMGVFYLVFAHLRGEGGVDFVAFLLVGLVLWQWFRLVISHAGNAIHGGLRLMRQVALAPVVFPLIVTFTDTLKFLIVLFLLLLVLPLLGFNQGLNSLFLLPVIMVQLLLIIGVCLIYSAIVPFVPDLKYLIDTALLALMFMSGIFYPIDSIQGDLAWLITLNPMAGIIDDARRVLLEGLQPLWGRMTMTAALGAVLVAFGVWLIRIFSPHYTKLST